MLLGRFHVLVVDDDAYVREFLEAMLEPEGFKVTAAPNGPAALRVIDDEPVDLAIVDVRMPGPLDGLEMVKQARGRHPQLKALFISGAARGPVYVDAYRDEFVSKPFRGKELLGCVFKILGPAPMVSDGVE